MGRSVRRVGIGLVAVSSLAIGMAIMRPEVVPSLSTAALLAVLGLTLLPILALGAWYLERSAA